MLTQIINAFAALLYYSLNKTKFVGKWQSNVFVSLTQIENTLLSKITKPNFLFYVVLVLDSETMIMII